MKSYFYFLKSKLGVIFRTSLYIIAILIVIYIFPKEGKFRYEFQKGSPWRHENLIAPFDFAIYKLDKEIKEEKDSIENNFKPYFNYKDDIYSLQILKLKNNFENNIKKHIKKDSLKRKNNKKYKNNNSKLKQKKIRTVLEYAIAKLKFIYEKGIIEPTELSTKKEEFNLLIRKNQVAEEYINTEIFTLKSAYEYLVNSLNDLKNDNANDQNIIVGINLLLNDNLSKYIQANLIYDQKTTEKVKKAALNNISLTRGMIQANERIIFTGELVDHEKFRILTSLKKEYEQSIGLEGSRLYIIIGQFIIIASIFLALFLFSYSNRKNIFNSNKNTLFIMLIVLSSIISAGLINKYHLFNIYLLPYLLTPVIIKTFFDERTALFTHLIASLTISYIVPNSFEFFVLQFMAGLFTILILKELQQRKQMFIISALVLVTYSLIYTGFALTHEGGLSKIDWIYYIYFAINSLLLLLAYPLIYAFEKLFGYISDVTLLELTDTNRPLLRKLAQEAPGTFQHSLQVANLAEEVIFRIGGNTQLVRAGAIYHDIGKLSAPLYYIENQVTGINPHDKLDFDKSAEVIINHVKAGVKLAQKYNLPKQIIDFIKTHHGTTKVQFFYKSFINKYPDKEIDIKIFTYPGPKPFSKETAVLMMSDSIEAASRSLKKYDKETLNNLVENIINYQISEGQFEETNITFNDIKTAKNILKEKLKNIYHGRIEYPK